MAVLELLPPTLERLAADVFAPPEEPDPQEAAFLPLEIHWASGQGWLAVRDPFSGAWHELRARDCPASWVDAAWQFAERRRLDRDGGDDPAPAAFAPSALWWA